VHRPEPSDTPLNTERLLRALDEHGVDFVVIGGIAGLVHGSAYPTYDLDVAYARGPDNLEKMAAALTELDVSLRGAPPDLPLQVDAKTLANGSNFTFDSPHGSFDILGHVPGISSYEELAHEASVESVDGVRIQVASIDHLIAMKRAANRTKDKLMLEEYIVIADEQGRLAEEGG
jgi:predicted nucleotidyltransferase